MQIPAFLHPHIPDHLRERAQAFSRFVWRRFVEDRCFDTAAVLAYGTLFALVPLIAAVFGIVSAFPLFDAWRETLTDFLFTHFVPGAARAVETYLLQFADQASRLTTVGVLVLLFSALWIMKNVEDVFNRIWRVGTPRPSGARFLVYWTALTLGPLLLVASLALSSWLLQSHWVADSGLSVLSETLLRALPLLVELAGFSLAYGMIPNRPVAWRHAVLGGVLATLLFELAKWGMGWYLRQVPSYEQIYGAVYLLPIFLIWIYLCWVVVLLCASIVASLSAFRFQPVARRLPADVEWLAALRLVARLLQAQRAGAPVGLQALREREPAIEDDTLVRLVERLAAAGFLHRNEAGQWLLLRDPQHTTLADLYAVVAAPLPLREPPAIGMDDAIGRRVLAASEPARQAALPHLHVALATLLDDLPLPDAAPCAPRSSSA